MKVCTIDDIKAIDRVMKHSDIAPFIGDDNSNNPYDVDYRDIINDKDVIFIMPNKDCVILFFRENDSCWEIHVNNLKTVRGENAIKSSSQALRFAFEEIPGCKDVCCSIPEKFKNVIKHTLFMGLKYKSTNENPCTIGGINYKEHVYTIRKDTWEQLGRQRNL
jgi:hypothetical protein